MRPRKSTNRVVFHHSLTDTGDAQTFRKHHIEHNHWEDIGYHYIITKSGEIQTGREISLEGSHAKGKNSNSIGICIVGNFFKYEPRVCQLNACAQIFHALCRRYGKSLDIDFHREITAENACPGPMLDREDFIEILKRHDPYMYSAT